MAENFRAIIDDLKSEGVSLRTIADRIGVDVSLLSRVYSGRRALSASVAKSMAAKFDLSESERESLFKEITNFTGLTIEEQAALGSELSSILKQ